MRNLSIISEGLSHLPNGNAQAVVELNKGVFRPQMLTHLFPGDDLSTPFYEHDQ
ncbi:MAG TPA: hypothetical protein VJT08_07445 [Terriglobales bacterium]|nr:hypothetical protein [Terriglobales bacterium]